MTALPALSRARLTAARASPSFVFVVSTALALAIGVPFLGVVGLWDPWETHYTEVAREMLARHDLVHPFWENSWFFSKPVLTMWLAMPALWAFDAASPGGAFSPSLEWFLRLPIAVLSALAVGVVAHHTARLSSARVGLLTGAVLATSPLWCFVSRQAMVDMPYVATATLAAFSLMRVVLDERAGRWWVDVAAVASALSLLAKGALGVAVPGLALVCAVAVRAVSWKAAWAQVREVISARALLLFVVVGVPWYVAMLRFSAVDHDGRTFFERFILYDHLGRLMQGVHSNTPQNVFTYFIEQLGYGFFPWVVVVPLALREAGSSPFARAVSAYGLVLFGVFSISATKFHHYALPVLPALAVLVALALARWWERAALPVSAWVGVVMVTLVARDLAKEPRKWIELFTYNHERPYPDALDRLSVLPGVPLDPHTLPWLFAALVAVALAVAWWRPARGRGAATAVLTVAVVNAAWLSWEHWPRYGTQWTQRELFARYFAQRTGSEPIAAFFMDWKGETFYSRNEVVQLGPSNFQQALPDFISHTGRKWMLVEHARLQWLTQLIGSPHRVQTLEPQANNKFVLLTVD
jgi:4-amino-4-deoxy-L-arabinose transferase-like glycosyltransferase